MNSLQDLIARFIQGESIPPIILDDRGIIETINTIRSTNFTRLDELRNEYVDGVFVFTPEDGESVKIEQTRDIIEQASMRSSGEYNIFVIESIDTLTLQAANSLLKLFEDIPPRLLFLLSSSSTPEKMLETIASRVIFISANTREYPLDPTLGSLLDQFFTGDRMGLMSYLYREKLEKESYLSLLIALQKRVVSGDITDPEVIQKIEDGIITINTTNANPRWVVDDVLLGI